VLAGGLMPSSPGALPALKGRCDSPGIDTVATNLLSGGFFETVQKKVQARSEHDRLDSEHSASQLLEGIVMV